MMKPTSLSVEITNACNARCPSCIRKFSTRPNVHMELPLFEKIFNEFKELENNIHDLALCGIGEPLMHPQFDAIADILGGSKWSIATNGQLLDKHFDSIIRNKPINICLSVDAIKEETYKITRTGLDFKRTYQNLQELLLRLKDTEQFWEFIYLQFIVTNYSAGEVNEFANFWLPKIKGINGATIQFRRLLPWPDHRANAYYGLPIPKMNYPIYPSEEAWSYYKVCTMPENFFCCHSDGHVSPCCICSEDAFQIGNLHDNTIMELFNNEKMNQIRELRKKGKGREIPYCSTCI